MDNGFNLSDGHRLLGNAKTWRGLCSAVYFTTVVAILFGIEPLTGALFGALTMTGDLLASFIKRRWEMLKAAGREVLIQCPNHCCQYGC